MVRKEEGSPHALRESGLAFIMALSEGGTPRETRLMGIRTMQTESRKRSYERPTLVKSPMRLQAATASGPITGNDDP